jgi:hypothetical protein
MSSSFRVAILAAGVAAFVSSEAVYAAPAASAIDPLVSLSVLAGGPAQAAVCAGSSAVTAAAAAAVQGAPGCVLPVTAAPPVVAPTSPTPPPPLAEAAAPKAIGTLPLLLGLAALAGVIALIATSGHHHNGDLTPVSPA